MEKLYISDLIEAKLRVKHGITRKDVCEAFANRQDGKYIKDTRLQHQTDPETVWFVALNNWGQNIKVVYMQFPDGTMLVKTAYKANPEEIRIFKKYGS